MHEAIIAEAVRDPKFLARFWSKVDKSGECWAWQGARSRIRGRARYGICRVRGSHTRRDTTAAHRVAWAIAFGSVPESLCVLHRCDNMACVRAEHLFLGTKADNNRDKAEKGRAPRMQFEANGFARLTRTDVRAIAEAKRRGDNNAVIGARFGVKKETIWALLRRLRDDGRLTHDFHLSEAPELPR